MKRKARHTQQAKRRRSVRTRRSGIQTEPARPIVEPIEEVESQRGPGIVLTGGDVDADWTRAESSGEEAVGGSVATPDQDVVDELGRALGVEQAPDAEVRTSEEILRERDRFRWHLAQKAEENEGEEKR